MLILYARCAIAEHYSGITSCNTMPLVNIPLQVVGFIYSSRTSAKLMARNMEAKQCNNQGQDKINPTGGYSTTIYNRNIMMRENLNNEN
jgi:hypothetical protein